MSHDVAENKNPEIGPMGIQFKRTIPFSDTAGFKDAAGNPISLTLYKGKVYTPVGAEYIENSWKAPIRPDDIIVCGYAKTGCHWIWEMMSMIQKGKGQWSVMGKGQGYLEFTNPVLYNAMPSPRILNTHNEFVFLPKQVESLKNKIVLTTRNPKDTAASLYNHHINIPEMYGYSGTFNDWFKLFLNGEVDNGDFFDYHVSWEKSIQDHPDHPIMVLRYEEAKEDLKGTIQKLADFMGVTLTQEQVDDIEGTINFNSMKSRFQSLPTSKLIRKGQVGDWKNWLSVEQSEELERRSDKYLKGTHFEPRYEI